MRGGVGLGYIELIKLKDVRPKNPVLVQGVPGLGLVGKIAANYLIESLESEKIAVIYSDYLPLPDGSSGVRIEEDIVPPSYDLYLAKGDNLDLIILTSEVQPTIFGQYEIGELVLDYAIQLGVKIVITMGGYVPGSPEVKGVFACSNDEEFMRRLNEVGVKTLTGGYVTGAAGLLVGLADLKGLTSACLLGTTNGAFPDPKASKMVLEALSKLFKFKIDLEKLEREAEIAAEVMKEEMKLPETEIYKEEEKGLPYHG